MEVTKQGLLSAFARIRGFIPFGTMTECPTLATLLGVDSVHIKYEGNLPTGSFKARGALNFASSVEPGTKLYTHSSGNWAQGIAYAGNRFKLPVVVYMKPTASALKRKRTIDWGAEVREIDGQPDQISLAVQTTAEQDGGVFVSPYDHPLIIEGHGSCGKEIALSCSAMKIAPSDVLVPVSGGGLAAGVAFAIKCEYPHANIVGVEPTGCDDFGRSLKGGERTAIAMPRTSIADGLLANQVGVSNWPVLLENVNSALTVTDDDMIRAMAFLFEEMGIVAEPSGAITVAAALRGEFKPKGKHVVIVVSGRNIETDAFLKMIGKAKKKTTKKTTTRKKVTTRT